MTTSKYDKFWECLSTNDFKKEIPEKFHCIICKNVTIEPYVASCECRFCYKCIEEHLKDEIRDCPGKKSECKEDILEMNVNVLRDIVSIRSIAQLKVKCPNDMCEARRTLDNMSDHIRICGMSSVKCPYEVMGCDGGQIPKDNIKTHYDDEWFTHSQLLVESIDILRNEVNRLSKAMERKDEEMNKLHEDFKEKELTILQMKRQIEEQGREIDILKDEGESRKREMEETKEEYRMMKETQKKTMMEELENVKRDIMERDGRGDIEDQQKSLNELRVNQENIEREINSVIIKVRNARIFDEREFIWRVDNFSKIQYNYAWRELIISRYSIKFNFTLRCRGGFFGHGFVICKGEFDEYIQRPMKYKITFSLINQETWKVYKSKEYKHDTYRNKSAFYQPREQNNYFIGDNKFITLQNIMNCPGLLLNDSLVVSFKIKH